jgi:4-hydroxybenzoate polyprenyltransferase/phosphoserine phosphatase
MSLALSAPNVARPDPGGSDAGTAPVADQPTSLGGRVARPRPLCVDLDGTLVRSDLAHEAIVSYLRHHPWSLWRLVGWLGQGRDILKAELAARTRLRPDLLPYRSDIVDHIAAHRRAGGEAHLVTASPRVWADAVAEHLGVFDSVSGSERGRNLKGRVKARHLVARFGERGFDYIGDCRDDRPVWRVAGTSLGAGGRAARHLAADASVFTDDRGTARSLLAAARPHQWLKNLLVFTALFTAHRVDDASAIVAALLAFAAFCCCASSAYLVNDLIDLENDRLHPRKRDRPFASGAARIADGVLLAPALIAAAMLLCLALPPAFAATLLVYYALTHAYSWTLKRRAPADVFTLAVLYTLRVVGGAAAIGAPLSLWLLAFSMFLFLGLATLKRHVELLEAADRGNGTAAGRGYWTGDGPVLVAMGVAAGSCAVVVLSFYVGQPHVAGLYETPALLWLICPMLLYWTSRLWLLAQRRQMHDDPVVFAVRDPVSRKTIALCALVASAAAELELAWSFVGA